MVEESMEEFCPRCRQEHDAEFKQEFFLNHEYKVSECPHCNYELRIKVN
ncbi:hypothetical protein GOV10_03405 [Candidatus Woesearchaeota archaeon]|nr:hypothetical protein [Candidatus Woesearchaeota archaeon]